jgi:hypothetical protein
VTASQRKRLGQDAEERREPRVSCARRFRFGGKKEAAGVCPICGPYLYLEFQSPFVIALHSGWEFAEFRAIRHGCLSIRLFTSCDSYPKPAPKLLVSHHHRSGRGAGGFILTGNSEGIVVLPAKSAFRKLGRGDQLAKVEVSEITVFKEVLRASFSSPRRLSRMHVALGLPSSMSFERAENEHCPQRQEEERDKYNEGFVLLKGQQLEYHA